MGSALKFSEAQRRDLSRLEGLSQAQVLELERALPDIAHYLQPIAPASAVDAQLNRLAEKAAALNREALRMARSIRPDPGAEAFGRLQMAGAQVGWNLSSMECGATGYPVAADLIQLVADITAFALHKSPGVQRHAGNASIHAIDAIVTALHKPTDPASRAAAACIKVTCTEPSPKRPSFLRLARMVFEVAAGNPAASPERAIRKYREACNGGQRLPDMLLEIVNAR